MKSYIKPFSLALLIIALDQGIKLYIKTHFFLGEEVAVFGNWFLLHFTENNGMAFGFEFAGQYGKLFLSLFRIIAVGGIGYGLAYAIKHRYHHLLITSIALIFAGAIGNIIDSVFYGLLFDYETLLHGRVVDMFYFPLFHTQLPNWFPLWGGEDFVFFRPVFNLADASISVGVAVILIFQKRIFPENQEPEKDVDSL